jgi:hypothetical protein
MLYSNPKNDNKSVSSKTMEINNYNCMKLIMIMIMITLDYDFLGYDFFVSTFCLPFVFFSPYSCVAVLVPGTVGPTAMGGAEDCHCYGPQ